MRYWLWRMGTSGMMGPWPTMDEALNFAKAFTGQEANGHALIAEYRDGVPMFVASGPALRSIMENWGVDR